MGEIISGVVCIVLTCMVLQGISQDRLIIADKAIAMKQSCEEDLPRTQQCIMKYVPATPLLSSRFTEKEIQTKRARLAELRAKARLPEGFVLELRGPTERANLIAEARALKAGVTINDHHSD